jgi:hypothetical protein
MICFCKTCSIMLSLHVFELWGIHCCVILLKSVVDGVNPQVHDLPM